MTTRSTLGLLIAAALLLAGPSMGLLQRQVTTRPLVEVRKPPTSLHAGALPPPDAPQHTRPGQWFVPPAGADGFTAIDVNLGVLGQSTDPDGRPREARVTMEVLAANPAEGLAASVELQPVVVSEPGWVRFHVEGLPPLATEYAFHLHAEGELTVVPWLRPRGRVLRNAGWGSQAREVGDYRGELGLTEGAPLPSALTLTAGGESITVPTVDGDAGGDHRWADPHGVAVLLRLKDARGCGPEADAFSLAAHDLPQHLADGSALLTWPD